MCESADRLAWDFSSKQITSSDKLLAAGGQATVPRLDAGASEVGPTAGPSASLLLRGDLCSHTFRGEHRERSRSRCYLVM